MTSFGPYDAVLVSAAFPEVPAPLVEQLRVGGRLVQPIGPGAEEEVVPFPRTTSGPERGQALTLARFVRLRGRHGSACGDPAGSQPNHPPERADVREVTVRPGNHALG